MKYNDPTGHDVGCPGYDASYCATNSPIRRLNQHSTPLYRTPILPKGPSQEHGSSLRAAPTNTPTPQTVIGPGPSKTPLPSSTLDESPEQKISVDWDKVDYVDLTIDVLGVIGDASLVIVPGPSVIIDGVVTVVEMGGAIKTGVEIYNNDYSGVSALSVDIAIEIIEDNPLVGARFGRMVPVLGIPLNAYSIYTNLNPQLVPTNKE